MRAPDFWQSRGPLALLLSPLGWLYGASVAMKARKAQPFTPAVPVICVGNLTAGGSGKTPIALAVGKALIAGGHKVFFLTRGYGGALAGPLVIHPHHNPAEVGDEALLLAQTAPTILAQDRAQGAQLAVAQGASVIVMDDGHQNFSLGKSLSLVVLGDMGNGLMIPAGPLREPMALGLARANAVVVMPEGAAPPGFTGPVLQARLVADGTGFAGKRVFAFAGIGRPEKFTASLQEVGAVITGTRFFADHHPYDMADIAGLKLAAKDAGLVTTAKDYVRLPEHLRGGIEVLPVEARFDDAVLLNRLLPQAPR